MYPALLCFAAVLAGMGVLLELLAGDVRNILPGLLKIAVTEDALITDYIQIAGVGAAFLNSALVTVLSVLILHCSKDPLNGYTLVEIGLMAGFALFGKNCVNIWPIILGTYLYAKSRRESFSKYASVSLLATALSPVVSFVALGGAWYSLGAGLLIGLFVGFVVPPLAAYTYRIQNGMNLYNMGFACGLLAMMMVPVMASLGHAPEVKLFWATGYNLPFAVLLSVLCLGLVITGLFFCGRPPWAAWAGYRRLLKATGRAPSDFLRMFGTPPVLINMGFCGIIGMCFILAAGGDLNGPTMGAIFTIMGFASYGKHPGNILPVMLGVVLGSLFMQWNLTDSAVQLACLFCTTLAPISGYFGWPYGILAGFLHSSVVLHAGTPVEGINLYNNGFSGGLIAIVLYPTITAIARHRKPVLQNEDYFDAFEHDEPVIPTHKKGIVVEERDTE